MSEKINILVRQNIIFSDNYMIRKGTVLRDVSVIRAKEGTKYKIKIDDNHFIHDKLFDRKCIEIGSTDLCLFDRIDEIKNSYDKISQDIELLNSSYNNIVKILNNFNNTLSIFNQNLLLLKGEIEELKIKYASLEDRIASIENNTGEVGGEAENVDVRE